MKVKLLVSLAGPTSAHNAGDEIDVDDATAKRFIECNMAEPIKHAHTKFHIRLLPALLRQCTEFAYRG